MSSHYLDVAIGLSYTFLAVSLLCSATREAIASLFQTRAKVLLDAVLTMLHESAGKKKIRGILPSIQRLLRLDRGFRLEQLGSQSLTAEYGKAQTAATLLAKVGNDGLSRTLLSIMGEGPDNVAALEVAVRIWYDTVMERTSGWYKRRSQMVLFGVGLFYACAMNIDALQLSQRLWGDAAATASLVQKATEAKPAAPGAIAPTPTQYTAQANQQLQQVKALPIGWPSSRFANAGDTGAFMLALLFALFGWIITAFASSLGAPFWFDGIGWLLALRGSGAKPPDTTPSSAPLVLPGSGTPT